MRKLAFGCIGVAGLALAASVVWGKEEPGSRATFGQRVSSLFGVIDTAEEGAPPTPPGMPPVGTHRHSHAPSMMPFAKRPTTKTPSRSGATATPGSTTRPGATAGEVKPPQPKRTSGYSEVGDAGDDEASAYAQPRPSLLMQSRSGSGGPSTSAATAGSTPRAATTRATIAPSATSPYAKTTPNAKPAPEAQAIPQSRPLVESAPPVMSSRRRPTGSTAPELPTGPSLTTSAAPLSGGAASSSGAANSEAFVPSLPPTIAAGETQPSTAVTANPQMSISPLRAAPPATASVAPASTPGAAGSVGAGPSLGVEPPAAFNAPQTMAQVPASFPTPSGVAGVLSSFTAPEITVETLGPARVSVGRHAEFKIVVRNRGSIEARDVTVGVGLPDWAEVQDVRGTSGHDASNENATVEATLQWRFDAVAPRGQEELTLVLVPRRNETFDLAVRWTSAPTGAKASIEVEQPQLQMAINGPTEVSYGEQRLYKLSVSNPGNGAAENVVLHLMPLSPGDGEAVSHRIGTLKAGESTTVEVELTARQAGTLKIRTEATADGGLRSEATADVAVRRAALDVVASAPRMLFAGVPGTYEVRVRNVGDDVARNVRLTLDLPPGAKLLSASPSLRSDAKSGPLAWSFDRLAAGSEQVCVVKCSMEQGGVQQLTVAASADGDLRKTAQAATDVQAVADLALDVVDTAGPVAVGQPVVYEIKVKNRGMKGAEAIDVVAYFSEGIEPEKAEGQAFELQPGMVVFKTLPTVGPNQERVLKVVARATTAGNHRLRVELRSAAPQTQLSHEDSTFFYADETTTGAALQAPATMSAPGASPIRPASGTVLPNTGSTTIAPAGGAATVYPAATANRPAVVPYYAPTGR